MRANLIGAVTVATLLALGAREARAGDTVRDGVSAATSSVATARQVLGDWARARPADDEVARDALELDPFLEVPWGPDRSLEAAVAAQRELEVVAGRLDELREKLLRQRERIVFGAARPQPAPEPETSDTGEWPTEIFDVRSLVASSPEPVAPTIGLPGRLINRPNPAIAGGVLIFDQPRVTSSTGVDAGKLLELLERLVPSELGSLEIDGGRLLVRRPPAIARRTREVLAELRAALEPARIALDVRAYRLPAETWAGLEREGAVLTPAGERRLAGATQAGGPARLLARETLVVRDGQQTALLIGEARTLLVPTEVAGVGSVDATTYHVGFRASITPTLEPDRRSARIVATFGRAEPLESAHVHACGSDVELPALSVARGAFTARVPLGRSVVAGGTFAGSDETVPSCVVVVRAALADPLGASSKDGIATASDETPRRERAIATSASGEVEKIDAVLDALEKAIDRVRSTSVYRFFALDARDVLVERASRPAVRLGLPVRQQASAGGFCFDDDFEELSGAIEPDRLEVLLKNATGADATWGDPAWYELHRGTILVHQTPAIVARMLDVLGKLRGRDAAIAHAEVGVYRLDPSLSRELEEVSGRPGALSPAALALLDREARSGDRAKLIAGGLTSQLDGERVNVSSGGERLYLGALGTSDGSLTMPILGMVRTGLSLEVELREDVGSTHPLRMTGKISWVRPLPGRIDETTVGKVEAPAVSLAQSEFDSALEPGWALVLERFAAGDEAPLAFVIRASKDAAR